MGAVEVQLHLLLTLALHGVVTFHVPATVPPGKAPSVCVEKGGWAGPRASQHALKDRKIFAPFSP